MYILDNTEGLLGRPEEILPKPKAGFSEAPAQYTSYWTVAKVFIIILVLHVSNFTYENHGTIQQKAHYLHDVFAFVKHPHLLLLLNGPRLNGPLYINGVHWFPTQWCW